VNAHSNRGIHALAALDDPVRARIHSIVRRARAPVTREEVALEAGISKALATFHLEKLLERGLLRAHYARPPGRSGPGAGRTAKYYDQSVLPVDVSIPPRRYDLAAKVLVHALEHQRPGEPGDDAAQRIAFERGNDLGSRISAEAKDGDAIDVLRRALERHGFEPARSNGEITLENCPFSELARESPALICGMNQQFLKGLVEGLRVTAVEVILDTEPHRCCARLRVSR
jgi:predicted ArsR family transcriptional regulator